MSALCRFFDTNGDGTVDGPEFLRGFFKMQNDFHTTVADRLNYDNDRRKVLGRQRGIRAVIVNGEREAEEEVCVGGWWGRRLARCGCMQKKEVAQTAPSSYLNPCPASPPSLGCLCVHRTETPQRDLRGARAAEPAVAR